MVSAKVFADDHMNENARLVLSMAHMMPQEFAKQYRENVTGITPDSGKHALRRSISAQIMGNRVTIMWRSKYAGAQQAGQMTVHQKRVVHTDRGFITLKPGVHYFKHYTTSGTGKDFAQIALERTKASFIENFYKAHPELK